MVEHYGHKKIHFRVPSENGGWSSKEKRRSLLLVLSHLWFLPLWFSLSWCQKRIHNKLQCSRKLIWISFGEDEMLQNLQQALPILWLSQPWALPWTIVGSLEMLAPCLSVQLLNTGEMGEWQADLRGGVTKKKFQLQIAIHYKLAVTCLPPEHIWATSSNACFI